MILVFFKVKDILLTGEQNFYHISLKYLSSSPKLSFLEEKRNSSSERNGYQCIFSMPRSALIFVGNHHFCWYQAQPHHINTGYTRKGAVSVLIEVEAQLPAGNERGTRLWLVSLPPESP